MAQTAPMQGEARKDRRSRRREAALRVDTSTDKAPPVGREPQEGMAAAPLDPAELVAVVAMLGGRT